MTLNRYAQRTDEKECSKCKEVFPLDLYYKRRSGKPRSACKKCTSKQRKERHQRNKEKDNAAMRKHYRENKEEYQKAHAIYSRSERGKKASERGRKRFLSTAKGIENTKKSQRKWADNNNHKQRAHWRVKAAVRSGTLVRCPCEVCGKENGEAHHEDYSKPLEVRWLCRDHHKREHRTIHV